MADALRLSVPQRSIFRPPTRGRARGHGAQGSARGSGSDRRRQISSCRIRRGREFEAIVGPVGSRIVTGRRDRKDRLSRQGRSGPLNGSGPRTRSGGHLGTSLSKCYRGRRESGRLPCQLRPQGVDAPKRTGSHPPGKTNCRETQGNEEWDRPKNNLTFARIRVFLIWFLLVAHFAPPHPWLLPLVRLGPRAERPIPLFCLDLERISHARRNPANRP